jgi:hypothetical protein
MREERRYFSRKGLTAERESESERRDTAEEGGG